MLILCAPISDGHFVAIPTHRRRKSHSLRPGKMWLSITSQFWHFNKVLEERHFFRRFQTNVSLPTFSKPSLFQRFPIRQSFDVLQSVGLPTFSKASVFRHSSQFRHYLFRRLKHRSSDIYHFSTQLSQFWRFFFRHLRRRTSDIYETSLFQQNSKNI